MSLVLKGVGKINGDGWKDTTFLGQIVYVWNTELPEPYKPGQYPRIGHPGWSASTGQYDFTPATAEEAKNAVESLVEELHYRITKLQSKLPQNAQAVAQRVREG